VGEYTKNEILARLSKHEIKHKRIVPYTHQQNGVAKGKTEL